MYIKALFIQHTFYVISFVRTLSVTMCAEQWSGPPLHRSHHVITTGADRDAEGSASSETGGRLGQRRTEVEEGGPIHY